MKFPTIEIKLMGGPRDGEVIESRGGMTHLEFENTPSGKVITRMWVRINNVDLEDRPIYKWLGYTHEI